MDKANPTVQNERTLWHGTSVDTLHSVNDTGFNRSYCGKNGKQQISVLTIAQSMRFDAITVVV